MEIEKCGWISTKDKLPEAGVPVLCYHELGGVSVSIVNGYRVFRWDGDDDIFMPTYWMPLPDLPPGGGLK